MAVKDRTKPIQLVVTKSPAKYLGPHTLLGLTRHLVQVSCEGVLITAWLTDEDFEKGFENVPEPQDKTYVNPLKAIRLRADAWTDRALERVGQVHCIVRCIRNGETWCDVKIMWKDGRTVIHPIKASDLYDAFENVPEESPVASITVDGERLAGAKSVDIECDNGAAPKPHEGNGEFQPEIDWKGEVECRPISKVGKSTAQWRDFWVFSADDNFHDRVFGVTKPHVTEPRTYLFANWEFRNKPKPESKYESEPDAKPQEHIVGLNYRDQHGEDERLVVYQVWAQYPADREGAPYWPVVMFTHTSRREAMRFVESQRQRCLMQGFEFAIVECLAPVVTKVTQDERANERDNRKPLWHVWAQYPENHNGIKFPFVVHTGTSRIAELGVLIAMRDGGAFPPGTRFAIASCKAPVMPEAAEV